MENKNEEGKIAARRERIMARLARIALETEGDLTIRDVREGRRGWGWASRAIAEIREQKRTEENLRLPSQTKERESSKVQQKYSTGQYSSYQLVPARER